MEVVSQNYNFNPSFGSVKLANLHLRKIMPDAQIAAVPAELHKLDAFDLPMIAKLYHSFEPKKAPKYLVDIYESFQNTLGNKNFKKPHSKIFLMIKQNGVVSAICEATSKPKSLYLNYISNFDQTNNVKGAGTSLIVNLVEFAKKTRKPAVTLNSVHDALDFYDKLGFEMINTAQDFEMKASQYDTFLDKFKLKYFEET